MNIKMGITRLAHYSFYYFIRERLSHSVLKAETSTEDKKVFVLPNQRLVVTKPITVYIDDNEVDSSLYSVYPETGILVFDESVEGVVTADYFYSFISVLDAYADDLISPPFLSIENRSDDSTPGELGSDATFISYDFRINLFGENEGNRDDLVDELKKAIYNSCPIIDFNNGFPVDENGKLVDFEKEVIGYMDLGLPRVVRNPLNSSDVIERCRAIIYVSGEVFN